MRILQLGIVIMWLILCIYYIPYSIVYRNLKSLKFVTVALILQNIMSLFASNTLPSFVASFIILYKEIILWGTVVWTILTKRKIKKSGMRIFLILLIREKEKYHMLQA